MRVMRGLTALPQTASRGWTNISRMFISPSQIYICVNEHRFIILLTNDIIGFMGVGWGGAEMWTMKQYSNKTLIEWWGLEAADVHISGVRVENSNSRGATADSLCQLFTKRTANICWSVSLWLTDAWSFPGSPLALTFPPSLSLCCLCLIFTL